MTTPDPMRLLLDALAGAVAERTRDELREIVHEAVADALAGRTSEPGPGTIRGLDPHALYPLPYVARRLHYTEAYLRDQVDRELLPRVQWKGGSIRYRGIDILRYEGVPESELRPANVVPITAARPAPVRRAAPASGKRIKNNSLPRL